MKDPFLPYKLEQRINLWLCIMDNCAKTSTKSKGIDVQIENFKKSPLFILKIENRLTNYYISHGYGS